MNHMIVIHYFMIFCHELFHLLIRKVDRMREYEIVEYLYFFMIGLVIGSFINVVVYRLPRDIAFVKGRSFCPNCYHILHSYDLVPILSYFCLRGTCRHCHTKISFRYPLVEIGGGLIACLVFYHYGYSMRSIVVFIFFMVLYTISLIDFDTMTIPNSLQLCLIPIIAWLIYLEYSIHITNRVIGFLCVSGLMLITNTFYKNSFGGGDIKFIAICGFLLGWVHTIVAGFIAIFLGGIYALFLLFTKKAKRGSQFAFGPFLSIGIMSSYLYASDIIYWYMRLF